MLSGQNVYDQFQVTESKNAGDPFIAFHAFQSFLLEDQMNSGYICAMYV